MLCTRADFFEGIIALSEVILEDASYRDQYSGMLEHALAVVEETQQKNSKNEISRITAILKSRSASRCSCCCCCIVNGAVLADCDLSLPSLSLSLSEWPSTACK